jgi:hypothetical protein
MVHVNVSICGDYYTFFKLVDIVCKGKKGTKKPGTPVDQKARFFEINMVIGAI